MPDARWLNTLAKNISSMDFAIVACIVGMVFFMKFNQHETKNKSNQYIAIALSAGFLMLVGFRIYKGF